LALRTAGGFPIFLAAKIVEETASRGEMKFKARTKLKPDETVAAEQDALIKDTNNAGG
jgi:hypothetical protein